MTSEENETNDDFKNCESFTVKAFWLISAYVIFSASVLIIGIIVLESTIWLSIDYFELIWLFIRNLLVKAK